MNPKNNNMANTIEDVLEKKFNEWEKLIPKELSELLSDFAMNHTYPVRGVLRNLFKAASLQTPSNEYWRERCEAAEAVIDKFAAIPLHPDVTERGKTIFNKWQKLKSTPIPILTPCVELEKEIERLKGLIEKALKTVFIWKQESDLTEAAWNKFKTENNL